ncbi:MAG: hypothetical protein JKY93_04370 [Gammaproteobacteria bacterium]|nr:hypothetical protein [Gammaproteobacteria bacterium]
MTLNVSDDDPGTLNWSISSAASQGTAGATGSGTSKAISYTPTLNYVGSDMFTVRVSNASTGLFDDHIVTVTINAVDDPPVITEGVGPIAKVIDEDNSPITFAQTLNATDLDTAAGSLTWSISGPASNGTATVSGTGLSKAISYTPNSNYNGGDAFTVQVTDGATPDTITINLTINPRNDAPNIAPISGQTGTENVVYNLTPTLTDPDDANNGTDITWSFVSGQQAGMTISSTGQIAWTPPTTGTFNQVYGPVTIRAADGGEHGSSADDEAFSITVSPPDADSDLVPDYNDFCPNQADASNADNDADGTAGTDTDPNDNIGGDVCDADDDNDGMPDTFEGNNGFDKNNAADATQDADGDGVTNLAEYQAGSNPNIADVSISATGYLTSYTSPLPDPTSVAVGATYVINGNPGPYRPGRNTITWTGANSSNSNLGTSNQMLDIRPLVSIEAFKLVEEGQAVSLQVTLNGNPPPCVPGSAPGTCTATVNYQVNAVSTTATSGADFNALSGTLTFTDGDLEETITVTTLSDALTDPDETVVVQLTTGINVAISDAKQATVTIKESNIAPSVSLAVQQASSNAIIIVTGSGEVTVNTNASDLNTGQTLSYSWTNTSNTLVPSGSDTDQSDGIWTFDPSGLAAGSYLIDVVVTDNGVPVLTTQDSLLLLVQTSAPVLTGTDTDGDGVADNTEGYDDSDGDGIPDYLDALEGVSESNLLQNQTNNQASTFIIMAEPGLMIRIGSTSTASASFGALVTDANVMNNANTDGSAPLNGDDTYEHIGGIYDFEISGVENSKSAKIVIPLEVSIPAGSVYRKFRPGFGWSTFVENTKNNVKSAAGGLGVCPAPGSALYVSGLIPAYNCIQLTIEDGGPNDADGKANGVIKDPGGVGVILSEPVAPTVSGGGRIHPIIIILLLLLMATKISRQYLALKIHK